MEMFSTAPVEIAVEISAIMWKRNTRRKFSTFPQALFKPPCGNVENF
jgi:hypothetical protein